MNKKIFKISTLILFIVVVLACSKQPTLAYYQLTVPSVKKVTAQQYSKRVLKVLYPQSFSIPLGEKMLFSYSSWEQGSYAHSEWSMGMTKLVEGALIQTLGKSMLFKAVLPYSSTATEDYRLESIVFDFSHRVRENYSEAVVSIGFSLVNAQNSTLVKSKRFTYSIATQTTDARGYAQATNEAMTKLVQDLLLWLEDR